jgi:hypothetical protein
MLEFCFSYHVKHDFYQEFYGAYYITPHQTRTGADIFAFYNQLKA